MNFWCVYMHWLAVFGDVIQLAVNGCAGHFERKFGVPPQLFIATVLVLCPLVLILTPLLPKLLVPKGVFIGTG